MYVYIKPTGPLLDCVAVLVWLKSANLKKRPVLLNAHTVCALQRVTNPLCSMSSSEVGAHVL